MATHSPPTDPLSVLTEKLTELPASQRKVAEYVLRSPSLANISTAREVGATVGVDAGTVVRCAQSLGFSGYAELRRQLRARHLATLTAKELTADQIHRLDESNAVGSMIRTDLQNLHLLEENLSISSVERLTNLLIASRRTLIVASGSYTAVGLVLAHLCQSLGLDVEVESHGGAILAAKLTTLQSDSAVVGISFWKGLQDTVTALEWAKKHGLKTFAITDSVFSPVARVADDAVFVPTESVAFFQSLTAALSVVYGIASLIWIKRKEASETAIEEMRGLFDQFGALPDSTEGAD